MITFRVSAVCRVKDGYSGKWIETGGLLCTLDGQRYKPVTKPGGYLILTDLSPGQHQLSLRVAGYQDERVELDGGTGIQERDITLKPGAGYPFHMPVAQLILAVTKGGRPAAEQSLWLAVPDGSELKIAQTRTESGETSFRLYGKGLPARLSLPGAYLIVDGKNSEIVCLQSVEKENGMLAAPFEKAHERGKILLPAQNYHTDAAGFLRAYLSGPCTAALFAPETGRVENLALSVGENQRQIAL